MKNKQKTENRKSEETGKLSKNGKGKKEKQGKLDNERKRGGERGKRKLQRITRTKTNLYRGLNLNKLDLQSAAY